MRRGTKHDGAAQNTSLHRTSPALRAPQVGECSSLPLYLLSMEKDPIAEAVARMFQSWGFEASRFGEADCGRSPDIPARYDSETYLVEKKEKLDCGNRMEAMEAAFCPSRPLPT